jgi:glycolate oxidase iron-sulfur subunit
VQTNLADWVKDTPEGKEADAILRKCVHCGFCTATCPTYQLLGDELDGPRGRIYLIKQVLEGAEVTAKTQLHLDRCLTCRNCETSCPSGVQYGHLVDIGRKLVEEKVGRTVEERAKRRAAATLFPLTGAFGLATTFGRLARPLLPASLRDKLPATVPSAGRWPAPRHARKMVALAGCVQPVLTPDTNAAAARVLDRLGISLVEATGAGCCGGVRFHLDYQAEGRDDMRRVIDAWWPHVERGVEAFAMTATGCGAIVREYGHHLRHDPGYAAKARRIVEMTKDLSEILAAETAALERLAPVGPLPKIAFHPPCSMQHWQKLGGVAEGVLARLGYRFAPVPDAHLCCGSAGTYSLTQPELSAQLKRNKLAALQSGLPELILTANVGCQTHLATGAAVPVRHWIVDLDERLARA